MTNVEETNPSVFHFAEGEVLLVDKPLEWTSFDVVGKLRNSMKPGKIKVGHAGTLDPLATGLLIICTGKFTKRIDSFQAEDKEYTGIINLSGSTASYDLETPVEQHEDYAAISEEDIHAVSQRFVGEISQYPPAHSAIKINGERVYEKARRGEEVALKARQIRISGFVIEKIDLPEVHFRITCSKGTYIRSIAHDFGQTLGIGAHLSALRRTKSGNFDVNDAWNLQDLIEKIKLQKTTNQE